ncbi:MAG: hypothetical protein DSZ01_05085, partial [Gammaproteobacteria bacterium]
MRILFLILAILFSNFGLAEEPGNAKEAPKDTLRWAGCGITKKAFMQASLRSRERFWDIRVPKIDSIFDNSLVPRPSWSPGVPPQHRKLV